MRQDIALHLRASVILGSLAASQAAFAQAAPVSASRIADVVPAALQTCPGSVVASTVDADRQSVYVPAADGVKLAVDIFLPKGLAPGAKLPALYTATRYWRGLKGAPMRDAEKLWIARGYAVVNADVRGTGASFGQWYMPYAPLEARDVGFLANWIAKQPWSNGKVVMTGTSYTATTALFAPAYGVPAVVAVAPKFSDFDLYADLVWPGGVPAEGLSLTWGRMVRKMDLNQSPMPQPASVRAVDGPDGDAQLNAAVEDHKLNPRGFDQAAYDVTYKDEPMIQYGGMAIDDAGVYKLQGAIGRSHVPIFGWGSWLDSGIAQGLINRFMTWPNPQLTIIGPWTHGARQDVNVFTPNKDVDPSLDAQEQMVYCFLSNYVNDQPRRFADHTLIYYTMGEDRWKQTTVWPVAGTHQMRFYLDTNNALSGRTPTAPGHDAYPVDFDASAGPANRWATQAGGPRIDYGDRAIPDRKLLVYTSAPLRHDMEVTGQPVITLHAASTHTDGNFLVYLEDVAPDGRVFYVSEGELRALHRKLAQTPGPYRTTYPYRAFTRHDAELLVPGRTTTLTFPLMATSALFKEGHRVRVAVAGADSGTFLRIPAPAQGPVTITVSRGGPEPSFIDLPVVPATGVVVPATHQQSN
jgi:uncharacterized protein